MDDNSFSFGFAAGQVYINGETAATTRDGRKIINEYNYVEERSQRGKPHLIMSHYVVLPTADVYCPFLLLSGQSVFFHTCKRKLADGHQVEMKQIISVREFHFFIDTNADPSRPVSYYHMRLCIGGKKKDL